MSCNLITFSSLLLLLLIHIISATKLSKPNCPQKCGNLSIPYPFGIGKGCYFDKEFEVTCNKSTNVASLPSFGGLNIYSISTQYVGVNSYNLPFLFNQSSGQHLDGALIGDGLPMGHYNYSHTKNKLVAMGCDVFAYIEDQTSGDIISQCASFCTLNSPRRRLSGGKENMRNSTCSGHGCCESLDISKPMTNFSAWMHTMNTLDKSWSGKSCGFLFIVDKGFSDYGKMDVSNCEATIELPLVLDWTISNKSCSEGATICGPNSHCVNYSGRRGYSCHCKSGYEGNPYLPNGCQDINECEAKHNCPKNAYCVNTPGGYTCKCRLGFHRTISSDECVPNEHTTTHDLILFICLGIGLSIVVLSITILGIWLHKGLKRKKQERIKRQFFKKNGGLLLLEQQISSFNKGSSVVEPRVFTIEELNKATDNFHVGRIVGKGGLGTVYKGMLMDGSIVALKKPNNELLDEKQIHQFINEIFILSQINHRNIVKVLGCCLEVKIPIVVYEYIPNGNLSRYLHSGRDSDSDSKKNIHKLSWADRLRIAADVAGALAYLHSCASRAIFHRDVKSSNILLDDGFRAVVSDFGLSRTVPVDKTHLTTTAVGGTFGYLDPEYFRSGQLNDKSDVYGFGVVLVELLTGLKVTPTEKDQDECLVSRFVSRGKQNRLLEVLDRQILSNNDSDSDNNNNNNNDVGAILAVAKIAKKCLRLSSRKRPCMKEVAAELDRLRKIGEEDYYNCSINLGKGYNYSFGTCGATDDSDDYDDDSSICSVEVV